MRINIPEMKRAGITVEISDDEEIEIYPAENKSGMFDALNKVLRESDLSRRNAEILADEFAGKAFNRYVWQVIDDG